MAKLTKFDNFSDNMFSFENFKFSQNGNNKLEHQKMLAMLKKISEKELTKKQKECLDMYYSQNLNTVKISKILGVYPSTVWRHIEKSKKKIKKIIGYYYKL